ncbi:MAG TPA: mannanase [Allosphingosinicella sp.]|nr:mannanase [Allosphingosinicella sp.]
MTRERISRPSGPGFSRRAVLAGGAAALVAGGTRGQATAPAFVTRDGTAFRLGGKRYTYAGANLWYAPWLGADAPYGDRARLGRELDRLAALGIDNVRVAASAENSPLRNSVKPAFRGPGAAYDETLLGGLDHVLTELARRDMRAVLYLTNFWEWSGGMMTYLLWTNGGRYLNMNDPAFPWPAFADFNAGFYRSAAATALYRDYVRAVVGRTNRVTGRPYRDDPAIMAWQLANEPRPAGSEAVGRPNLPAFYAWIRDTARLIKALDPNHLVSTGSEGLKGCLESEEIVLASHAFPEIDYLTAHIWPQNWSWVDGNDLPGTWPRGEGLVRDYVARHLAMASRLGKPLVIEEFGFPRDGVRYDPGTPTLYRDRYYRLIYDAALADAQAGGPAAGTNFWAWNGEGRAAHADHRFRAGDTAWLGDPPHEPQGWYGLFDGDASTLAIVRDHAAAMRALRS